MERNTRRTAGPLITARSTGITVEVEQNVWDKINGWCNAAKTEVSGMFCVKQIEGGFRAYEAFLPEQLCSSGYTVFNDESYARMKNYVFEKYGMEAMLDLARGWWHTHYNFSPFWSGTDDSTAQQHMEHADGDWAVSIVVNQKNAPGGDARKSVESGAFYKCRADILKPMKITAEDLAVTIVPDSYKRRKKKNYEWDIQRWVGPLVYRKPKPVYIPKVVVFDEIRTEVPEDGNYVNHGGRLIKKDAYKALQMGLLDYCPCDDYSCKDCIETISYLPMLGKI